MDENPTSVFALILSAIFVLKTGFFLLTFPSFIESNKVIAVPEGTSLLCDETPKFLYQTHPINF